MRITYLTSLILTIYILLLSSCVPPPTEEKLESNENYVTSNFCIPYGEYGGRECIDKIENATWAAENRTCNSAGSGYEYQECTVMICNDGYEVENNTCISEGSEYDPKLLCPPNAPYSEEPCTSTHATVSNKTKSCNSTGSGYIYGECKPVVCASGYYYNPETVECLSKICTEGAGYGTDSCTDQISNSLYATQTVTCNMAGTGFEYGACTATECVSNYSLDENRCIPTMCIADTSYGVVDCTSIKSYATSASKAKTCNSEGTNYIYGTCEIESCQSKYEPSPDKTFCKSIAPEGGCIPDMGYGTISCVITDEAETAVGTGFKTSTCNSEGTDYDYGECTLLSCYNSYNQSGNTCIPQVCSPGSNLGLLVCTVEADGIDEHTNASKEKTCNASGTEILYGQCITLSCIDDGPTIYHIVNGKCVIQECVPSESEIIAEVRGDGNDEEDTCLNSLSEKATEATRTELCNAAGTGLASTTCEITNCNDDGDYGYYPSQTSCLPRICEPETYAGEGEDCTASINHATKASRTRYCNEEGSAYVIGDECLIDTDGCESGYHVSTNKKYCSQNVCDPDKKYPDAYCEIQNSTLGSRETYCNSDGSGFIYSDACVITACKKNDIGYFLSVDTAPNPDVYTCNEYVCTPDEIDYSETHLRTDTPWPEGHTFTDPLAYKIIKHAQCNSEGSVIEMTNWETLECTNQYDPEVPTSGLNYLDEETGTCKTYSCRPCIPEGEETTCSTAVSETTVCYTTDYLAKDPYRYDECNQNGVVSTGPCLWDSCRDLYGPAHFTGSTDVNPPYGRVGTFGRCSISQHSSCNAGEYQEIIDCSPLEAAYERNASHPLINWGSKNPPNDSYRDTYKYRYCVGGDWSTVTNPCLLYCAYGFIFESNQSEADFGKCVILTPTDGLIYDLATFVVGCPKQDGSPGGTTTDYKYQSCSDFKYGANKFLALKSNYAPGGATSGLQEAINAGLTGPISDSGYNYRPCSNEHWQYTGVDLWFNVSGGNSNIASHRCDHYENNQHCVAFYNNGTTSWINPASYTTTTWNNLTTSMTNGTPPTLQNVNAYIYSCVPAGHMNTSTYISTPPAHPLTYEAGARNQGIDCWHDSSNTTNSDKERAICEDGTPGSYKYRYCNKWNGYKWIWEGDYFDTTECTQGGF